MMLWASPARADQEDSKAQEQRKIAADLASGDDARIQAALDELQTLAIRTPGMIQILIDAKRYDDADALALKVMLTRASTGGYYMEIPEQMRAEALLREGKPKEALAAAKAYYNVACLRDTSRAIEMVARCLTAANPDDKTIARRFRRQQMAGAATQPTAQPDDLGPPILAAIQIDDSPFTTALSAVYLEDYSDYVAKGYLLLASGKAKEARAVFERAVDLAPDDKTAEAIENVARAIRAEAGCVGPANAYILKMQNAGK